MSDYEKVIIRQVYFLCVLCIILGFGIGVAVMEGYR